MDSIWCAQCSMRASVDVNNHANAMQIWISTIYYPDFYITLHYSIFLMLLLRSLGFKFILRFVSHCLCIGFCHEANSLHIFSNRNGGFCILLTMRDRIGESIGCHSRNLSFRRSMCKTCEIQMFSNSTTSFNLEFKLMS